MATWLVRDGIEDQLARDRCSGLPRWRRSLRSVVVVVVSRMAMSNDMMVMVVRWIVGDALMRRCSIRGEAEHVEGTWVMKCWAV